MTSPDNLAADLQHALGDTYAVRRELGGGGMSRVFVAHDASLDREVVVKVLSPLLAVGVSADRFGREIRLAAGLQDPHIVPVLSAGVTEGGLPWYTMPFVEGASLRERMNAGPVPVAEAAEILRDVAQALAYAHAHGVVHRDIKPENVLLSAGTAVVADFGIAKALSAARGDAPGGTLTDAGVSLGTPAYMAPEQAAGEQVDARADLYSWGVVAWELLAGRHPFAGRNARQLIAAHLSEPPADLRGALPESARRDPLAHDVARLAMQCLAKDPALRPASANELADTLRTSAARSARRSSRLAAVVGAVALVVVAAAAAGIWWSRAKARAVAALPRIQALAARGEYPAAYELAMSVRRHFAGDSAFAAALAEVSNTFDIRSHPAGAEVYLAAFGDTTIADSADGRRVGAAPLEGYVVPRGDHRVTLRAPGHLPARRLLSRSLAPGAAAAGRAIAVDIELTPERAVPEGMERVPGGAYEIVGHDAGRGRTAELSTFALDRFEVSNERYAEFVRSGRYPSGFSDRTGLPGPRAWQDGRPPQEQLRYPVTGVSWHEAAAYCAWRDARLPTLFEWEKASRDGRRSRRGVLMPWGEYDPQATGMPRANFAGSGPVAVDRFPFGISPWGVYNTAGNVKEWIANRVGDGWGTVGGSWQDPAYLFSQVGSQTDGSPVIGFRCAHTLAQAAGDQGAAPIPLDTEAPVYVPVGRAEFTRFLEHYRYDPIPANARVSAVVATADWTRERVWIDGQRGDSVLVYVYLPRRAAPPYQPILMIGSSASFGAEPVTRQAENTHGGLIRAGRAMIVPVLTGMVERQSGPQQQLDPASVAFRDAMVRHATEVRLAMDYAASRPDIDASRFAYLAASFGAGSRIVFAAVDPRFRAVVLVGAGVDERIQPTLPEAANFNFAPYIAAPKLVINGRHDEEHPWATRGRAMWNLLRDPKQLVLIEGAGHLPPAEARVPPINRFLDSLLGPVR